MIRIFDLIVRNKDFILDPFLFFPAGKRRIDQMAGRDFQNLFQSRKQKNEDQMTESMFLEAKIKGEMQLKSAPKNINSKSNLSRTSMTRIYNTRIL